jgi:hypothetical protein
MPSHSTVHRGGKRRLVLCPFYLFYLPEMTATIRIGCLDQVCEVCLEYNSNGGNYATVHIPILLLVIFVCALAL